MMDLAEKVKNLELISVRLGKTEAYLAVAKFVDDLLAEGSDRPLYFVSKFLAEKVEELK